jgi:hypothetical protein
MSRMIPIAILVAAYGCSHGTPTEPKLTGAPMKMIDEQSSPALGESEILDIAKAQVAKNDTWADRAEYTSTKDENGWVVVVWFIPKVFGGVRYIEIDNNGNVVRYSRGK